MISVGEHERGIQALRVELWSHASPQIVASVMGMGLANVLTREGTVTWCSSPSRVVLTGGERVAHLHAIAGVAAHLSNLSRELSTGKLPVEALASQLSLHASYARSIAAQSECQETVKWHACMQGRIAEGRA